MAGAGFAGPWLPFAASTLANPAAPRPLFSGFVSLFRRLVAHHCTYLQWPFPPLQVRSAGQGRAVASAHEYCTVTRTYLRYRGSWRRAGAGRGYNCCDCRYLEYINLMLLSRQLTDDIGEAGAAPSAGRYLYLSQLGATLSCLPHHSAHGAVRYHPSCTVPVPTSRPCSRPHQQLFHVHQIPRLYHECTFCTP